MGLKVGEKYDSNDDQQDGEQLFDRVGGRIVPVANGHEGGNDVVAGVDVDHKMVLLVFNWQV